jgi:hypothetical protein
MRELDLPCALGAQFRRIVKKVVTIVRFFGFDDPMRCVQKEEKSA